MGDSLRADEIRNDLARNRARGLLTLTKRRPPIDNPAIIDLAGIPWSAPCQKAHWLSRWGAGNG